MILNIIPKMWINLNIVNKPYIIASRNRRCFRSKWPRCSAQACAPATCAAWRRSTRSACCSTTTRYSLWTTSTTTIQLCSPSDPLITCPSTTRSRWPTTVHPSTTQGMKAASELFSSSYSWKILNITESHFAFEYLEFGKIEYFSTSVRHFCSPVSTDIKWKAFSFMNLCPYIPKNADTNHFISM